MLTFRVLWKCSKMKKTFFEEMHPIQKWSNQGERESYLHIYEGEICNRITRISLKIWCSDVLWGFSPVLCKSTVLPWLIQFNLCKMWNQPLENAILWWSDQWSNFKCYSTCVIQQTNLPRTPKKALLNAVTGRKRFPSVFHLNYMIRSLTFQ